MTRAASIVEYTVNPENADELHKRVRDFLVPAARQTKGYQGFLLFDRGEGKRLAVLVYDSVEDIRAAQSALTPVGEEHTYSLMSGPALGSLGVVVVSDGVLGEPAKR